MEGPGHSAGGVRGIPKGQAEDYYPEEELDTDEYSEDEGPYNRHEANRYNAEVQQTVVQNKKEIWLKKNDENERAINKIVDEAKVKLSDGTIGSVFSRGPLYSNGFWPVNCHLCNISNLAHFPALKKHISKNKHQTLLVQECIDATKFNAGVAQKTTKKNNYLNNCIRIYPGEKITKITPKLKERLLPVADKIFGPRPPLPIFNRLCESEQLQKYNKKAPVLGLSYCFYVDNLTMIGYYCSLCKKHVAEADGYHHFVGRTHRTTYAQKHFPKLLSRLLDIFSAIKLDATKKENIADEVIRKMYRSIEDIKGLQRVQIVRTKTYACQCLKFTKRVIHYGDNHVLVTDEELKEMIEKCRKGENLLAPDPPNLNDKLKSSTQLSIPVRGQDNIVDWDSYRRTLGDMLDEMDGKYADYEKTPEKHPAYQHEWKKFWNRRYSEIKLKGLNPDNYNFQNEWIPEWKKIKESIYNTAITYRKFKIKKKFGLQFDKRSPSPIRKQQAQSHKRLPSPPVISASRRRPRSRSPVNRARRIESPPALSVSRRRTRSRSPVNSARQIESPPAISASRRRTRSRSPVNRARKIESPQAIAKPSEEPPGVVSVLRLLTAIDEYLGSLAPKALEYLSKSLLYEKDNGQSANQLLFNQEYYLFFVTAKEKLKGQLIANLIKTRQYNAVTLVIKALETLIEMFDDFCKRTGRTVTAQPKNDRPKTPNQQESHFNDDDQYGGRSQDDCNRNRRQDVDRIGDRSQDDYNRNRRQDVDRIGNRSQDDYNRKRRQDVGRIGDRSQDDYSRNRRQDVDGIGDRSQDDYNRNRQKDFGRIGDRAQDDYNRNIQPNFDGTGDSSQDDYNKNRRQDVDRIGDRSQDDYNRNRRQYVDRIGDRSQDDYNRDRRQDVDRIGDRTQDHCNRNIQPNFDAIGDRSQDDYNRKIQQDFHRNRNDNNPYDQYQRGSGEMDQYRSSGCYNNQYDRLQDQYDIASSSQFNDNAPNSDEYGQNRSMTSYSNQASSSNQYSRGDQGEPWQRRTNMTFRNDANNAHGSGSNSGGGIYGNYSNNENRSTQENQNFHGDRNEHLSTSYGDRGGNYNSNIGRSARNYNSNVGNRDGNYSAYSSGAEGNFNSGYGGYNPECDMAPLGGLVDKPLDNYGDYSRSYMNTRGFDGGNF